MTVERADLNALETRVGERIKETNKRVDGIDERLRVTEQSAAANKNHDGEQDRRIETLEQGMVEMKLHVDGVKEAAAGATAEFSGLKQEIAAIRQKSKPEDEGFKAWIANWRAAVTPTNVTLLIVILSTLGALIRGEITRDDAEAQIRRAAETAVIAEQTRQLARDTGLVRTRAIKAEKAAKGKTP